MEEYSLKFTMFSRYAPSFVSNPMYLMSMFVTGVVDLLKEVYCTTMQHDDIKVSRLMMYAQSVEESKICRISRNFKRGRVYEKNQPRLRSVLQTKM